jgi:hypothetical protein
MTEREAWHALGAAVARIVQLEKNREAEWWSIGDEVTRLLDGPAGKLLAFAGPREMFGSTVVATPYPELARYAEARRMTTSDEGRRFPASNIAAFQEYEKAVGGRHEPGTLADQVVEVPAPDGGVKPKRFAHCSQQEIEAATHWKLAPKPAPSVSPPPQPSPPRVAIAAPAVESRGPWLGVLIIAAVAAAVVLPFSGRRSDVSVPTPAAPPALSSPAHVEERPPARAEAPPAKAVEPPPPTPTPLLVPAETPAPRPTPVKKPTVKAPKHRLSGPPLRISSPPQWGSPTATPSVVAAPAAPKAETWGKPAGTPLPAESPEKLFAEADAEKDSHPRDAEAKLRRVIEMTKFGTDLHDRAYALLKRLEHSHRE